MGDHRRHDISDGKGVLYLLYTLTFRSISATIYCTDIVRIVRIVRKIIFKNVQVYEFSTNCHEGFIVSARTSLK